MSNLIIYTDGNGAELQSLCQNVVDYEVIVKSADEVKDMSAEEAAIAIIDMPLEKLKEILMLKRVY